MRSDIVNNNLILKMSKTFSAANLPAMMLGCCGCLPEDCFAVVGGCQA